jgi:acetyltransferase-like isoleucine patch superfamily enzyme
LGRYCSLNDSSYLLTGGNHHREYVSTCGFKWLLGVGESEPSTNKGAIVIGNDVWSEFASIIMGGVTIGDGGYRCGRGGRHSGRAAVRHRGGCARSHYCVRT